MTSVLSANTVAIAIGKILVLHSAQAAMIDINATTHKLAPGGQVTNWVSGVKPARTKHVPDDPLTDAFGDKIGDSLEYEATCAGEKQDKGKPKEPTAPFMQAPNLKSSKRKANKIHVLDEVSEAESDWSMEIEGIDDSIMGTDKSQPEPIVVKKEKVLRTTTLMSVTTAVADSQLPAQKKAKIEPSAAPVCGVPAKLKHQQNVPVDTMPEHMKARDAYCTVDLPAAMQADQCWTKKYLPTILLWAGSYKDIWVIPDDVLLHHAQLIFDAVYKDLNIVLVHNGVVHSLTARHISEWRSNFGSTAIAIIMDFMTRTSDCAPSDLAMSLVHNWVFIYEDPNSPSPLTAYRSPFILQLLGRAHFNAIKGKKAIKLPKIVNKLTEKETNVPFLFLATLWSKPTKGFIKLILNKPAGYVEATIEMARTANGATDMPSSNNEE
ncbi:hypothetical protein EV424DRAFT_1352814 [Suillus variegatus]|nr:hypothetical protein EV424DRAFT_1352814 [Suillus variegatus]